MGFTHGQIIRIDYGVKEYWVETMAIRLSDNGKHYHTAMHRKSHPKIECADKWKADSLESYGRVVLDLSLATSKVPS